MDTINPLPCSPSVFHCYVLEEVGHGLVVMDPPDGFCQEDGDIHGVNPRALRLLRFVRIRIRYNDFVQLRLIEHPRGVRREDSVRGHGVDLHRAVLLQKRRGVDEAFNIVNHIVDDDSDATGNVADDRRGRFFFGRRVGKHRAHAHSEHARLQQGRFFIVERHWRRRSSSILKRPFIRPRIMLGIILLQDSVNNSEAESKALRIAGGTPSCHGVLSHDDGVHVVGDAVHDVLEEEGAGAEVVHPTAEEALGLLGVEVESDDVGEASSADHLRHEFEGDVATTSHLGLVTVWEVGQHANDVLAADALASVCHHEKLEDAVVDVLGAGLQDVHVLAAH